MSASDLPTLGDVDRDGALLEAVAALHGDTRAEFLRKAAIGSGAMLAILGAAPAAASAAGNRLRDRDVLQFGLRFERLQASFYTEAETVGTVGRMAPEKRRWAETLGAHERAHVRIIKRVLGHRAGPRPFFDFRGVTEKEDAFTRTTVAMEDLTVALLTGVAPGMHDRQLTAALFSLMTVEARHAAWARRLVGTTPAARAFDDPRPVPDVASIIADTRFVVNRPTTRRRRRGPRFTG
jgi:Ferritin-like domain